MKSKRKSTWRDVQFKAPMVGNWNLCQLHGILTLVFVEIDPSLLCDRHARKAIACNSEGMNSWPLDGNGSWRAILSNIIIQFIFTIILSPLSSCHSPILPPLWSLHPCCILFSFHVCFHPSTQFILDHHHFCTKCISHLLFHPLPHIIHDLHHYNS